MRKTAFHMLRMLLAAVLLTTVALPMQADYSKSQPGRNGRYHRHGSDVCVIEINQEGSVEDYFKRHDMATVRLLVVNGPITKDDINYIKKIANRSQAFDDNRKKIDNYLDVDLSHSVMMNNKENFGRMSNCDHLRSIILPEYTRRIESNALSNCKKLEEVIMPDCMRIIGDRAFDGCVRLENIYLEDGIQEIGDRAFNGCKRIRSLFLPKSLRTIGDQAFNGTGLREIQLPSSLRDLAASAFAGTDIRRIDIPANCKIKGSLCAMTSLQYIGVDYGNKLYSSDNGVLLTADGTTIMSCPPAYQGVYRVQDGVQVIADKAFMNCQALTAVDLPSSLTTVGQDAFNNCKGLCAIDFRSPVSFGKNAFSDCTSLTDFTFGGNPTEPLPMGLFEGCTALTDLVLPESVTEIPRYCFRNCSQLYDINLPAGLKVIDRGSFRGTAVESVVLPDGVTIVDKDAFRDCKRLTEFKAGAGLTEIGEDAFNGCENLASAILNEGLTTIDDKAFNNCALTTLTIPGTVTKVGKGIVDKNKGLTRLTCLAPLPPKLDKASNNKVQLLVPAASVNSYKQAKNWKDYRNIAPAE